MRLLLLTFLIYVSVFASKSCANEIAPDVAAASRVFDTPAQQAEAGKMLMNYQINRQLQSSQIRAQKLSQITTPQQVLERARAAKLAYIKSMGGLPSERAPLKAQVVGEIDRGDYVIRKVLFQDFDQMWVSANLYLPKPLGNTPRPAVVSPMGHTAAGKNADWFQERAIQLVKIGYIVLGYDPIGMGERWQYWDAETGKSFIGNRDETGALTRKDMNTTAEHSYAGVQAWLVGQSASQYMIWDGMRAVDYLLTLPEVDPHRIGCSGASLGGSTTMMLAAIDPRINCAVPTCDVTSFEEMAKAKTARDAEQIPLGINVGHFEQADALLPMLLHGGSAMINANAQDFFPIAGSRQAASELQRMYTIAGVPTHFAFAENQGTHGWFPGTYASFYHFLGQQFSFGPADPQQQVTAKDTLKQSQLWCTPQGQVNAAPLNSKTVFDRTAQTAIQLQSQRRMHNDAEVIKAARQRSGVQEFPITPTAKLSEQTSFQNLIIEKWTLNIETGISLPGIFIHSADSTPLPQKVLLYCSMEGKSTVFDSQNFPLQNWLAKGNAVFAVDVRGWGETSGSDETETTLTFNALQDGRPLVGQRATDLLETARWLDAQKGKRIATNAEISLWGDGSAGVCALHAMAGDNHHVIHNVILNHTLYSYQDWATTRFYNVPVGLVIPGILEDYDLPQLTRVLQNCSHDNSAVIWVNPLDATNHELSMDQLQMISKNTTGKTTPEIITSTPLDATNQALKLLMKNAQ